MHALKQQSNWLDYIKLKPEKDPRHEKRMNELRQAKKVDELLRALASFFCVSDVDVIDIEGLFSLILIVFYLLHRKYKMH